VIAERAGVGAQHALVVVHGEDHASGAPYDDGTQRSAR
jgi:hypothetical protein